MAGLRVLVADDNPINQKIMVSVLKSMGHTGIVVGDGEKVLRCLAQMSFDLLLLDVQMPLMDGLEALKQIREDEREGKKSGHLPVIMVTANDLPGDREIFLRKGADGYACKPVNQEVLEGEIKRVLGLI